MPDDSERMFEPLTVADVFCGAGGLSEGFRQAVDAAGEPAFDVIFGVDRDPDCVETFRENVLSGTREDRARRSPARTVVGLTAADILEAAGVDAIDILVGGPNCQAVSSAGRRNLDDDRNKMFGEYVRLVEELQPSWFVMENVPGLTHASGLPLLREIFERFGELKGYEVAGDVLLAADYGVPQYRYRLFIIGTNTGSPIRLPAPSHFADRSPVYRTVGDVIERSAKGLARERSDATTEGNARRTVHVPVGGDWRDIPVDLLPDRSFAVRTSDQVGAYGRLSWDAPAFTITSLAHNVTAGPFTHPDENRALNVGEAAALQGFRSDYRFAGSLTSRFRQVGNAVPPGVSKALAEAIVAARGVSTETLRSPRLTADVVEAAATGRKRLPVMTPRVRTGSTTKPTRTAASPTSPPLAARAATASSPIRDNDLARLRAESALPKYSWTGKRAKAILGILDGANVDALAAELKISAEAARRWHEEFISTGVEGWRAYHTPSDLLAGGNELTASRIRAAIVRVREPALGDEVRQGKARAHMNDALRALIARFAGQSVNDIVAKLAAMGRPPGTMYVGDLLAVADILVSDEVQLRESDAGAALSTA